MLKIFIGYDEVECVAWHTLTQSIIDNSQHPIAIIPVSLKHLNMVFSRERDIKQSNDFSFSRFLVPYLSKYEGFSIFMDCDMLLRCDINEVLKIIDAQPNKAIYVVKHDYIPKNDSKFLNSVQYNYPRKNWSSFILWDCGHPSNRVVDLKMVNTATGLELHRFSWLKDEEIGELPTEWNWLVGEYLENNTSVKNIHWTLGGPYFNEYKNTDFSEEWLLYKNKINYCKQK